jgi:hypothetical protein
MSLRTSKKLFWPLVVFLILLFCPLVLSFSLAFSTPLAEGISALEICDKDSTIPSLEELGISEDIYSLPCLGPATALQKQEGYSIIALVLPLPDKPPAT